MREREGEREREGGRDRPQVTLWRGGTSRRLRERERESAGESFYIVIIGFFPSILSS